MATQAEGLEFLLLGPLRVRDEGREVPVPAAKLRTVLAAMLLHANQTVTADELVLHLWGENPPGGAHITLRSYVMRLRRILLPRRGEGPEPIRTVPGGYLLNADETCLDLLRFRSTLAAAQRAAGEGDHPGRGALLREALALWNGPALSNVPSDSLHRDFVPGLTELRDSALEQRIDLDLARGAHHEVVAELHDVVRASPWRERFWAQLMLALYRQGRQAEALDAYQRIAERLRDELGIAVGPELRRLHQRILAADPALDPPVRVAAPLLAASAFAAPVTVRTPCELPADPQNFVGRRAELGRTRDLLSGPDRRGDAVPVLVVDGMAGVGKTAFAVRLAHRLAPHFPDGQLFADLQGFAQPRPAVRPAAVLGLLLRSLGVPGPELPPGTGARAALLRRLTQDRRMLLVLDDVSDEAQIRPLLPLPPGCRALVTSRCRLAGLDRSSLLTLDVLAPAEASRLFTALVGERRVKAEPVHLVEAVVEHCGRLPLALKLAAARLRARPGWKLGHLAERLSSGHSAGAYGIARALQLSYLRLTAPQRRMLHRLALGQERDIDSRAAAPLAGVTPGEAETLLESLADANLLQEPTPGRYRLHRLVQTFAAGQEAA
jgi:DNA-binding SARP family transcriptional activator